MVPTLLGLADIPAQPDMQGRDVSALLTGAGGEAPESVYLQSYTSTERDEFPPWRGVRTERHTYARHEDRPWMLHDNQQDPFQLANLAGKPTHGKLETELDALTTQWFEDTEGRLGQSQRPPVSLVTGPRRARGAP